MKRRRFVLISMLAVAVGSISLASCGEPEYEYVRNTQARTAFKVPHGWTIFDEATMQGDPQGAQASTPDPVEWLVGLDGDPSPSREHVLTFTEGYDTGIRRASPASTACPPRCGTGSTSPSCGT